MPRRRDESRAAQAARLYHEENLTIREIGTLLHVQHSTVACWVDPARRTGPRGRTDVTDDEILRLRDQDHLPFTAIAEEVGMSKTGVRMRYYALTGRPRPGRASC